LAIKSNELTVDYKLTNNVDKRKMGFLNINK